MTIDGLFRNRQSYYYKNLGKYLKYVLNDHFVILLLVLGGATGLAYQNYLESVQVEALLPKVILSLVIILVIFSGNIRTLVKPADAVFLLPKEKEFNLIMRKNLVYSLIFHVFYTIVIGFLSVPLLIGIEQMEPDNQIIWLLTLVFWKVTHGIHSYYSLKQHQLETSRNIRYVINVISLTGILTSIFISVFIGFFIALAALSIFFLYVFIYTRSQNWNWESLIETEQRRTQKIYSIINMFIETPYSKHKVKRLKFLDFFYTFSVFNQNPEIYFLSRMFIRNYNFSGLYLRLVLIGGIAIYFSNNWIINSVISVLFLYLIGFQLIPMRQAFKKTVYFRLYPNTDTDKINTIQKLLVILLVGSTIVYSLASISSGWFTMTALLVINIMFIYLFVYGYLPRRLNKKEKFS
ncbi:ABC transporter permease [Alkalibacterium sp. f15]|uniref:ABC transporter permease n=1 Tax=Alkalibacterium sp. f15 TaxID=3414029 RepID=UPI003BF8BC1E